MAAPWMNPTLAARVLLAFVLSVLTSYVLASIAQSMFVLAALGRAGMDIPMAVRLRVIAHDLYGLIALGYISFGLALLAGFAVALPIAAMMLKVARLPSVLIYGLAGAAAVATILFVVQLKFFPNMSFFAGTRGACAYLAQLAAGVVGGVTFGGLMKRRKAA